MGSPLIARVVRMAASRYVAGTTVAHALERGRRLRDGGFGCTLGYWDSGGERPEAVAREYERALEASRLLGGYVSVKATALDFSRELVERLAGRGVRLHFDAMAPETVDRTEALVEGLPGEIGVTLPGRWARSDEDAERAAERGRHVRVVKGMWRGGDDRDPAAGFLSVVARLAGRARFVAVATHDRALAGRALAQLRDAGTPCELEQLYGLPRAAPPATVYLPYGTAWLPYALAHVGPRTAWWLARDLALSPLVSARRPAGAGAAAASRPSPEATRPG